MVGRWTEALILDLRARRAAGESLLKLAEEHGVSKQRMHSLLAGSPIRNEIIWTNELQNRLRKLWDEGLSATDIAKRMGNVSKSAVVGKARRLKLAARDNPILNQHSWTEEQRETLRLHVAQGMGDAEIARRMNMTVNAVANQRRARGYVRPAVDKMVKPRPVLKKAIRPVPVKPVLPPTPVIDLPLLETNWRYQQPTDSERLCKWPFNGGRPWKFCCEMRDGTRAYCASHWRLGHAEAGEPRPGFVPAVAVERMQDRGTLTARGAAWNGVKE